MSYTDQTSRRSSTSIAAVVGVHVVIGYALVSGLATKVVPFIPVITIGEILPDDAPPPPLHEDTVKRTLPTAQPVHTDPIRNAPVEPEATVTQTVDTAEVAGGTGGGSTPIYYPVEPAKPSLARAAIAGSDRIGWITTDDYPAAALRQGTTGTVVIAATIGTDGRVHGCEVTRSSGSALLDDTTCRLYARRAHFTPASDADGNPIAAQRTDRFRWQIPN